MAGDPKPVLGYRHCDICQERGTIHQAGGKRTGSLYQRCGCGCLQGNGKWMQSRFWYETEWLHPDQLPERVELPEKPRTVVSEEEYQARFGAASKPDDTGEETVPESGGGDTPEEEAKAPGSDGDPAPGEPEAESKGRGKLWLVASGLLVGALAIVARGS